MLKHFGAGAAGTGFMTCTAKVVASMPTKVEGRLQPKHLELYSHGYSESASKGMQILEDLQSLARHLESLSTCSP